MFHLRAPRSLGDPDLRHFNAAIAHATSHDLHTWTPHGDVLVPAAPGNWDDLALWTGSVVADPRGGWAMLYTACSRAEDGLVQRIGLATSPDLATWTRHPDNPVIEADSRWYELSDDTRWHDLAWRDPWVMVDPDDDGFHALITARVPDGPTTGAGVIGRAHSRDLVRWEVGAPLTAASGLGHLEVPQVVDLAPESKGRHALVFSYDPDVLRPDRRSPDVTSGSFVVPMGGPLGPVDLTDMRPLGLPGTYSNKVVRDRDGVLQVLGFVNRPGPDHLTLTDPTPLASYLA
nr:hypothetical protein [Salsipaludibacter albus]